jgi:hypothetical protein
MVTTPSSKLGMNAAFLLANIGTIMYFDPDTVALLRTTLDRAWASLPESQRLVTSRSLLAERILILGRQDEGSAILTGFALTRYRDALISGLRVERQGQRSDRWLCTKEKSSGSYCQWSKERIYPYFLP